MSEIDRDATADPDSAGRSDADASQSTKTMEICQELTRLKRAHDWAAYCDCVLSVLSTIDGKDLAAASTALAVVDRLSRDWPRRVSQQLLFRVQGSFRRTELFHRMSIMCGCPLRFCSQSEAKVWDARIHPQHYQALPILAADAWLARARSAAWRNDNTQLRKHLDQALDLCSADSAPRFWFAHEFLQNEDSRAEELPPGPLPPEEQQADSDEACKPQPTIPHDQPEWRLVNLYLAAKQSPGCQEINALVDRFEVEHRDLDIITQRVVLDLLKHVCTQPTDLTSTSSESPPASQNLQSENSQPGLLHFARWARRVERLAGRRAWTDFVIATADININGDFNAAQQRLARYAQSEEIISGIPLVDAYAVATLLCGDRLDGFDLGPLAVLNSVMSRLTLVKFRLLSVENADVLSELLKLQTHRLCVWAPIFGQAIQILRDWYEAVFFCDGGGACILPQEHSNAPAGPNRYKDVVQYFYRFRRSSVQASINQAPASGARLPNWLRFLQLRLNLLTCGKVPDDEAGQLVADDWQTDVFQAIYQIPDSPDGTSTKKRRSRIEAHLTNLPPDMQKSLRARLAPRHGDFSAGLHSEVVPMSDDAWSLGRHMQSIMEYDLKIESSIQNARMQIRTGDVTTATEQLAGLEESLEDHVPVVAFFWRPAVQYWHAMALARNNNATSLSKLESLLDGPAKRIASIQLAQLTLLYDNSEFAVRLLNDIDAESLEYFYVRTLVCVQEQDWETAADWLTRCEQSIEQSSSAEVSPCTQPVKRLRALIAENVGDLSTALQILTELAESPTEDASSAVLAARMLRIRVKQVFSADVKSEDWSADDLATLISAAKDIEWTRGYALLTELLRQEKHDLKSTADRIDELVPDAKNRAAWYQLLLHTKLNETHPNDAQQLINRLPLQALPGWMLRTKLVLDVWQCARLVALAAIGANQQAAEGVDASDVPPDRLIEARRAVQLVLREFQRPQMLRHAERLAEWRSLAEAAERCLQQADRALHDIQSDLPTAWSEICQLWSADRSTQQQAANELLRKLQGENILWLPEQQQLLKALATAILGNDRELVEAFEQVSSQAAAGPLKEGDLLLAALLAGLRTKQLSRIRPHTAACGLPRGDDQQARLTRSLLLACQADGVLPTEASGDSDPVSVLNQARQLLTAQPGE